MNFVNWDRFDNASRTVRQYLRIFVMSVVVAIATSSLNIPMASAHWADLSLIDLMVGDTSAQMTSLPP